MKHDDPNKEFSMNPSRRWGPEGVPWPIIHLDRSDPGDSGDGVGDLAPDGAGCLRITWSDGFPVAAMVFQPSGAGSYPHPAKPCDEAWSRPLLPPPLYPSDDPSTERLSVVIPTRDRPDDLQRCLASFKEQSSAPHEIIVVDNAPSDERTRGVALAAGVRYVREDRRGLDQARNTGVMAARGTIVAFCDDDVALHPDWCRQILAAFDDRQIQAATGLVLPLELATPAQRIFEFEWGFGRGFSRIDHDAAFFRRTMARGCPVWTLGAGASMAFRRSVFERVGLFDERLDAGAAGCSGDSEFWYRILAAGGTCRYEPRIVSWHRHRRSIDDLRRQIRAYMRGHTVALLVQYQRHGHFGNLRRAFLSLPVHYLRRIALRLLGRDDGALLLDEIAGYLSGFVYFGRHPRLVTRFPFNAGASRSHDHE